SLRDPLGPLHLSSAQPGRRLAAAGREPDQLVDHSAVRVAAGPVAAHAGPWAASLDPDRAVLRARDHRVAVRGDLLERAAQRPGAARRAARAQPLAARLASAAPVDRRRARGPAPARSLTLPARPALLDWLGARAVTRQLCATRSLA